MTVYGEPALVSAGVTHDAWPDVNVWTSPPFVHVTAAPALDFTVNVTSPEAVPALDVTVAPKVTDWPDNEGFLDDETVVLVV